MSPVYPIRHPDALHRCVRGAIAFVMRTNKRRNLTSGLWATVAVEAEEIMAAIQEQVAKEKGGRPKAEEKPTQKIDSVSKNERRTDNQAATLFHTNRAYVNQATKNQVRQKIAPPEMEPQAGVRGIRD